MDELVPGLPPGSGVRGGPYARTPDTPPGADMLVTNAHGHAWMYVDRQSTNGVILAATNLDLDTHAFHGRDVARSSSVLVFAARS